MSTYKGFNSVKLTRPERSNFDLSHEKRLSTQMGKLTPVLVMETIPNDTFRVRTEMLLRLAPTLAPFMHRLNAFVHYFFVPNRLLWEEWPDFITAGEDGTSAPIPPYKNDGAIISQLTVGGLPDYMGVDPALIDGTANVELQMMPFAAYYRIWYDYYRDRNFIPDNELLPLPSGSITDQAAEDLCTMRYRAWQHDYFTSALPFTQRGGEVLMPLQGGGTVTYLAESELYPVNNPGLGDGVLTQGTAGQLTNNVGLSGSAGAVRLENIDEVILNSSSVSINDLRQAVRLQEWLERNALAGSRYNEAIMAHFGRRTSDSRLQRAEYLGGGKVTIKVNEVVNTAWSQDAGSNPVPAGTMSGHAVAYTDKPGFTYNCEEHGFIIGILSVMPVSAYMQGLPRMFLSRKTFLDYPFPSFAHLGEQPVYDFEIYGDTTTATPDPVTGEYPIFGYQSRYAEWKHMISTSHGEFRQSLDFWHLTRKFEGLPTLGAEFNTLNPEEVQRIFAVNAGTDNLWIYLYNDVKAVRSLPYFGTPML